MPITAMMRNNPIIIKKIGQAATIAHPPMNNRPNVNTTPMSYIIYYSRKNVNTQQYVYSR